MLRNEIITLSEHLDTRSSEMRRLQNTVESYKLSNEELNVSRCGSKWMPRLVVTG